jgi:polyisoprenoid-binding protein YceI
MSNNNRWTIDLTHSEIAFKIRHLMIAHIRGAFKTFDANIYTTETDFATAEIDVWIEAASINTGDAKRDEHLRGADFFDAGAHKQISFKANSIEKADGEGMHDLWGELTIKGITKNIKLQVEFGGILKDPWGKERAGFTITGKINRSDWGLGWNTALDTGGLMIGDEVKISCEIELVNTGNTEQTIEWEAIPEQSDSL